MLLCKYVAPAPRLVNNLSLTTKTSLIATITLIITVITVTNRDDMKVREIKQLFNL